MVDSPTHPSPGPLEEALDDDNVLVPLQYPELQEQFLSSVEAQKAEIEAMICLQLGVRWSRVGVCEIWRSGSFNVAIPIRLSGQRNVYLRLALPYRIGEREAPGNTEEKLRTETATYLWLQENCPNVPTPVLHAFGLPDGPTVSTRIVPRRRPWRLTSPVHAPNQYAFLGTNVVECKALALRLVATGSRSPCPTIDPSWARSGLSTDQRSPGEETRALVVRSLPRRVIPGEAIPRTRTHLGVHERQPPAADRVIISLLGWVEDQYSAGRIRQTLDSLGPFSK